MSLFLVSYFHQDGAVLVCIDFLTKTKVVYEA